MWNAKAVTLCRCCSRIFSIGVIGKIALLIIITVLWKMTCCVKEVVLFGARFLIRLFGRSSLPSKRLCWRCGCLHPPCLWFFGGGKTLGLLMDFFFLTLKHRVTGETDPPTRRQLHIKVPKFIWVSSTFWLRLLSYLDKVVNVGIIVLIVFTCFHPL